MKSIKEWQKEVHQVALEHGWWPQEESKFVDLSQVNIPEKLALIHSEISEALEEYRKGHGYNIYVMDEREEGIYPSEVATINDIDPYEKPEGIAVELADAMIRILDLSGALGIDIEECINIKNEYNKTRPYRHGNKKC